MSAISHDEASGIWLLQMAGSCYAMDTSDSGLPRHLHWGRPLGLSALAELSCGDTEIALAEQFSWSEQERLEHLPWGGRRYDEPTLKVDYPDGTRSVEWRLGNSTVQRHGDAVTLIRELADPAEPLRVELGYRIFDDCDVLERWALIRHAGSEGTITVRQAHSASWWLPPRPSWRLSYLHGGWAGETQVADTVLGAHKVVLESRRGATSHQLQPWVAFEAGGAAEDQGEVWSAAIAWSGSWKIVAEAVPGGGVHCSGGWNDFDSALQLMPGDEIVLPVFAGLYSPAAWGQ